MSPEQILHKAIELINLNGVLPLATATMKPTAYFPGSVHVGYVTGIVFGTDNRGTLEMLSHQTSQTFHLTLDQIDSLTA